MGETDFSAYYTVAFIYLIFLPWLDKIHRVVILKYWSTEQEDWAQGIECQREILQKLSIFFIVPPPPRQGYRQFALCGIETNKDHHPGVGRSLAQLGESFILDLSRSGKLRQRVEKELTGAHYHLQSIDDFKSHYVHGETHLKNNNKK